MENCWENLLQEAWEKNETVVFTELEKLVEMVRSATEEAMKGSVNTVKELLHRIKRLVKRG